MGFLPEIGEDGKLILSKEEAAYTRKKFTNNLISPERKKKLGESLAIVKAKQLEKDLKNADSVAAELNNLDRKEVTEDFSDSPHADREEITEEEE